MSALWFRSALLPGAWERNVRVRLANGHIAHVDTGVAAEPGDEQHEIGLPGMPNVHSHAFQRAIAGRTERAGSQRDTFWTWREALYRFLDAIGPEEIEAVSALAFMEMLEAGFTRVGEFHYVHHDPEGRPYSDKAALAARVAAAAEETGIGLTLLPVMYAHSGFGGLPPGPGQRRFIHDVAGFARLFEESRRVVGRLEGGAIGIAPHSLRAVTPAELEALLESCRDVPVHIHAAEQMKEVEDCLAWSGQRPVEWLLDHAGIDGRWCIVHATHVTPDEVRRLAASEAVAGLCPITEANLGDGIFPARPFTQAGGRFAIGSDSNVLISVTEELRMLEYSQRLATQSRNVLQGPQDRSTGSGLYKAALAGGAQALGVSRWGIRAGAPADIVTLDAQHVCLAGRRDDEVLDAWIFSAREPVVDCVWRYGRKVVSGGRHVCRERITARFLTVMERLLS